MWKPRQGVRCILRTVNPPPPPHWFAQVCLQCILLVCSGRFQAWRQERAWKVTELRVIVDTAFCFTLLLVCVFHGNVSDRRLVQGVNCRLVSGCLTGLGAGLRLWLGHEVWDGV